MKIGQFACRWAMLEHTVSNCLRRAMEMTQDQASVMIFPLTLDTKMARLGHYMKNSEPTAYKKWLFGELVPLVKAMRFLRNTTLHGVVMDNEQDEPYFDLRSKGHKLTKAQLFRCEDLINYTAHVVHAFRYSLGEKDDPEGHTFALPDRPPIPEFLPEECRAFPPGDRVEP